jgi:ubiquinone biosynthesis protein
MSVWIAYSPGGVIPREQAFASPRRREALTSVRQERSVNLTGEAIGRLGQILGAMVKYGYDHYLQEGGLGRYFGLGGKQETPLRRIPGPVRLKMALEKLGPTFIKFGQLLAMRPDLLPQEYCNELFGLLDEVSPFPYETVRGIVKAELGGDPEQLFRYFHRQPLKSASLGQVHFALLKTGERVAVKVQRPGIQKIMEGDIALMRAISKIVDRTGRLSQVALEPVVEEFARWTQEELDYRVEARHASRFYRNARSNPFERIPKVFWDYVGKTVLTEEFLDGLLLSDAVRAIRGHPERRREMLARTGIDLDLVAQRLSNNAFRQIFVHNCFHADPHPANIIVLSGNVIGYIDFGIVGSLDESVRSEQLSYMSATLKGDVDEIYESLLELVSPSPKTDLRAFEREFKARARDWYELRRWSVIASRPVIPLEERSVAHFMETCMKSVRAHRLTIPLDIVALYRTLLMIDSTNYLIAPQFDLSDEFESFFMDFRRKWVFSSVLSVEEIGRMLLAYGNLIAHLPQRIKLSVDKIAADNLSVRAVTSESQELREAKNARSKVASIGLLALALCIALDATKQNQTAFGVLLLACLGVIIWLLVALRSLT